MDFGEALFLMRAGKIVRRKSWDSFWAGVQIEKTKGISSFVILDSMGNSVILSMNSEMVLAEDWEEAK